MQHPKSNNVILLDEPFRDLSLDLHPKASEMIQEIAQKLALQIIMITHSDDLTDAADRVFRAQKIKKETIS